MKIIKAKNYEEMSRKAANIVIAQMTLFPKSVLGLATGSTPLGVYKKLIEANKNRDIDFSSIHSVNLDEYCGFAPDNNQSYRYYMDHNLFNYVNIKPENTHVLNGLASNFEEECKRYEKLICDLGGIDLQLLGIGHTGHIAFNEPDTHFYTITHRVQLDKQTVEANARFFASKGEVPTHALTIGIKSIMQARRILLFANGEDKAEILHRSLFGEVSPFVPASVLQLHAEVTVVADEAALSQILEKEDISLI